MDQNTPVNLTCCAGVTNDVFMITRLRHFSVRNQNILLVDMINQLPILPVSQYQSLLKRKSLVQIVRLLVARVLSTALPQDLLLKLKLP